MKKINLNKRVKCIHCGRDFSNYSSGIYYTGGFVCCRCNAIQKNKKLKWHEI